MANFGSWTFEPAQHLGNKRKSLLFRRLVFSGRNDWIYSFHSPFGPPNGVAYTIASAEPLRCFKPLLRNLFTKTPPTSGGVFLNGRVDPL